MPGKKKKIRILLVNGPITSLFMAAWLQQKQIQKEADWLTVGIYCEIDHDESFSDDIEAKKPIFMRACQAALRGRVNEWLICSPIRRDYHFTLKKPVEIFKERKARKKELEFIRTAVNNVGYSLASVKEIWYANSRFTPHFFYLCPESLGIHFEHGLSDVRNAIIRGKDFYDDNTGKIGFLPLLLKRPLSKMYAWLGQQAHKRLIYFSPAIVKADQHVSLLREEIEEANSQLNIQDIKKSTVLDISLSVCRNDPYYAALSKLEGSNAIILLPSLFWSAKNKADYMKFFDSFEQYLDDYWTAVLKKYEIENLIFKSKFFKETYAEEGFQKFFRLKKNFKLILPFNYPKQNYPVEYYLPVIQPKMILGSYSSGLFYSKKIFPAVITFTYDDWFIDYCTKNFKKAFHTDYFWVRDFFYKNYREAFKYIHPKSLEVRRSLS